MLSKVNCYHNTNCFNNDLLNGQYLNLHNSQQSKMTFCTQCALEIYLISNKGKCLLRKGIKYDIYTVEMLNHPQILKQLTKNKKSFKKLVKLITSRIDFYLTTPNHDKLNKSVNIATNCAKWMDLLNAFIVYASKKKSIMKYLWNMNNGYFIKQYVINVMDKLNNTPYHEFSIVCCRHFSKQFIELKEEKYIKFILMSTMYPSSLFKAQIMRLYDFSVRCNNKKCEIRYFKHKFMDLTFQKCLEYIVEKQKRLGINLMLPLNLEDPDYSEWDALSRREWYKCGGCKMVYYCSRHCQKYDWNIFNHKAICCKLKN
eukprot:67655_1